MKERLRSHPPVLVKEVAAPANAQSSIGVLAVASFVMLFAVASAAFVLRAQMGAAPCPQAQTQQTTAERKAPAPPAGDIEPALRDAPCGEAAYRENADGSVTVVYELCDRRSPRTGELGGVEIRAVHPR